MRHLGLYKALEEYGMKSVTTAVGDRHVVEAMRQDGVNIGGETSGHNFLFEVQHTGDGMHSGILLLNVMKKTGQKLSELAAPVKDYPTKLVHVKVAEQENWTAVPENSAAIDTVEKEMAGDGRVLVRPTGTEPLLRDLAEAQTEDLVTRYVDTIVDVVKQEMGSSEAVLWFELN